MVNLKDANRYKELGKGTLYVSLCRKLNESTLGQYQRWVFENGRWELVETLKQFVIQEAEFQTVASETIRGINAANKVIEQRQRKILLRECAETRSTKKPWISPV